MQLTKKLYKVEIIHFDEIVKKHIILTLFNANASAIYHPHPPSGALLTGCSIFCAIVTF